MTIKIEYTIASFEAAFFYGAFDFFRFRVEGISNERDRRREKKDKSVAWNDLSDNTLQFD